MTAPLPCGCDPEQGYTCPEHRTRGVQVCDGLILFGAPWPEWVASYPDGVLSIHPWPPWLGGLDADEYARILGRAS